MIQSLTTFGLTKLIRVGEFGAWREFVLFAGFTGLLHVGFADGLQVSWFRNEGDSHGPDPRWALKTILITHLGWVGLALTISVLFPSLEAFPFFVTVVALYALVLNGSTALQYQLQCTRQFFRLSSFVIAFPALFLVIVLCLILAHAATAFHLALGYCVAAGAASTLILPRKRPELDADQPQNGGLAYATGIVRLGLPILALNYSVLGLVNFDKIAASPLYTAAPFARYGFAAALLAIVNSIIAGSSRVMLPALAQHATAGTLSSVVRPATDKVVLVWAVSLVSYFPAAMVVTRFLPAYIPALAMTRLFFVGSIFLAVPQIVHLNACRALRIERDYLKVSLVILGGAMPVALLVGHVLGMAALPLLSILVTFIWTAVGGRLLRTLKVQTHDWLITFTVAWAIGLFLVASFSLRPATGAMLYLCSLVPISGVRYWSRLRVS